MSIFALPGHSPTERLTCTLPAILNQVPAQRLLCISSSNHARRRRLIRCNFGRFPLREVLKLEFSCCRLSGKLIVLGLESKCAAVKKLGRCLFFIAYTFTARLCAKF